MHLVGTKPQHNQRRVWFAYAALILMNIIDVVYTRAILFVDTTTEANPIMNHMYQNFGIWGIITVKAFFLTLLGFTIKHLPELHAGYRTVFYAAVIIYAVLAVYHAYWLFGLDPRWISNLHTG